MRDDWPRRAIGTFATESRLPGSTGDRARKITVKLYGRGAVPKGEATPGSASTRYYQRRRGQLIYSKLDFLNGAFAVVPHELDGFESTLDLPAFDLSEDVDADWFRRLVSQPSFYMSFGGDAKGSRKARRVNPEEFLSREIRVPPLAEQRKIAAILSSIDETIEKTEAVIAQLEALQASLLHDEIHRALAGAPPCSIGDLAEFGNGRGFSPEEWSDQGLPIIRIQNLNGRREFNHYAGVAKDEWLVHPGDLLFAWAGSRGASFGPCIWRGPVGVLNQHIYRVLPSAGVDRDFLYWLLVFVTREVEQRAHGFKQTLVHLKKEELTSWPAGLPTLAVQVLLAERLGSLAQRIEAEWQVLAATRGLKESLSDGLLSGGVLASCEVVAS